MIADAPLNVRPIDAHAGMQDGKERGKIRGRDGVKKLTYDTGVMKGSLDDTNAGITPGYPQRPFCHPFRPLPTRIANPE